MVTIIAGSFHQNGQGSEWNDWVWGVHSHSRPPDDKTVKTRNTGNLVGLFQVMVRSLGNKIFISHLEKLFPLQKLKWMKMLQVLSAWKNWGLSWQKRGRWNYLLKNLSPWWEEPPMRTLELSTTKLSLIISPKTLKKSTSSGIRRKSAIQFLLKSIYKVIFYELKPTTVSKERYLCLVFRWLLRLRTLKVSSQSSFLTIVIFYDVLQIDKLWLYNNM